MRTLYVVRHGRTDSNEQGVLAGHRDVALSSVGVLDARRVARTLRNVSFDVVYSSDLQRATATAQEILSRGVQGAGLKTSRRLREIDFGLATGMPKRQALERYARAFTDPEHSFPRGESFTDVCRRVKQFVSRLPKNGTFLVVTHAGVVRALQVLYENADPVRVRNQVIPNASIKIFKI